MKKLYGVNLFNDKKLFLGVSLLYLCSSSICIINNIFYIICV